MRHGRVFWETDSAGGTCPSLLEYQGVEYEEVTSNRELPGTKQLGTGTLPSCGDVNDTAEDGEKVDVWRIRGIEPTVAVAVPKGGALGMVAAATTTPVVSVHEVSLATDK